MCTLGYIWPINCAKKPNAFFMLQYLVSYKFYQLDEMINHNKQLCII